jgi:hypothetical protein
VTLKEKRKKELKRRKNFFLTLIVIFILWSALALIVYFVEPFSFGAVPIFFLLFFLTSLFSAATLFANTRRGLFVALGLALFLFLRYLGIGNILNFLLIVGVVITFELYFSSRT